MALTVNFWGFGKRENSTVYPTTTPLKSYTNVILKDSCSVVAPVLKINEPVTTNVTTMNYCYILEFDRYYYVTNWRWDNGIWVAVLSVDVLASFRTLIGFHTFYILRSYQDSAGHLLYDGNITDTTYPVTADAPTYSHDSDVNPFAGYDYGTAGTFIVGIISEGSAGITYYAFNSAGYTDFCSLLFNYSTGWIGSGLTEISADLQKALINPFQYVVSAIFMPISFGWFATEGYQVRTSIKFGWWSVSLTGNNKAYVLPKNVLYQFTNTLTIPKHPQSNSRGNYLNLNPYTTYTLRYYPFGVFDIDSLAISNYSTLNIATDIDVVTGKAIMTLYVTSKSEPIRIAQGNVSIPMPTISINVDYTNLGSLSTIVMAGASAASQIGQGTGTFLQNAKQKVADFARTTAPWEIGKIADNLTESVSNIASAVIASKATAEINGMQGAFKLPATQSLSLSARFLQIADEDIAHRGRPLCQQRMIDDLRGFIMCADADVSIPCTDSERTAINNYLNSGFYYYP